MKGELSVLSNLIAHHLVINRLQQEWISCQRESRDVDQSQDVIHG